MIAYYGFLSIFPLLLVFVTTLGFFLHLARYRNEVLETVRYDGAGKLVGITLVKAKQSLDGAKPIVITIPERVTIDPAALAPVVQSAA